MQGELNIFYVYIFVMCCVGKRNISSLHYMCACMQRSKTSPLCVMHVCRGTSNLYLFHICKGRDLVINSLIFVLCILLSCHHQGGDC